MLQKEEIVNVIEKAFDGATLDGGISLEQTKVIDNYGRGVTAEEFTNLPKKEITDNWKKIPVSQLDEADCIAHLDQKGFKYYIPALILRLLENYDSTSLASIGTISFLYPKLKDWEYSYSELTPEQSQAIALFLKSLPDLVKLKIEDKTRVERALKKYWSKFLPSQEHE